MHMKQMAGLVLTMAIALLAIADIVHDFIVNDPVRYFSEQPRQLLLVAVIGIAGGLAVFGFSALSPQSQRRIRLVLLGFATLISGYCSFVFFQTASLLARFGLADLTFPRYLPWLFVFGTAVGAGLIWFEFRQVLKSRDRAA
jgi:hypothetical protein